MLKTPFPEDGGADPSRRWPEEDVKEFIKGLRMYGKNFFKIRQEFLPHRDTPELVEFYYLWKKTPGAANNRPRGRRPRPGVIRRVKTSGTTSKGKGHRNEDDPDDLSSCSEEPNDDPNENGENSENGDLSPYYCRHCFTTSSRDWHHAGKEKILVCLDCRLYFKKYGELPHLEPVNLADKEEEETTTEEELEDIKPPIDKKIDINAIEQDSSTEDTSAFNNVNGNDDTAPAENAANPIPMDEANNSEPLEIKGELPKSVPGLVSPVPTMPAHVPAYAGNNVPVSQPLPLHQGMPNMSSPASHVVSSAPSVSTPLPMSTVTSMASLPPTSVSSVHPGPPPPAHSNSDVQILTKPQAQASSQPPPAAHPMPQPAQAAHPVHSLPPQQQPHPNHQQQQQQPPPPPREDSPPPRPDGSECHRSQSAIFTRQWNRGEGNSCSRTDLFFKPVPDSKLARKREERLRRAANEREEAMKAQAHQAQEQAAKVARMEMNHFDPFSRQNPSNVPPPMGIPQLGSNPYAAAAAAAGHMSDLERFERERAMNAALASAAGSPRPPYPSAPGTPGPPPGSAAAAAAAFNSHITNLDNNRRMAEELMARGSLERQYMERMALATDPLVRLQLAGVNPEIPGSALHHPAYASLMAAGNPLAGGPRPPPGFDPRFRSPAELMFRPPPGLSPRPASIPPDFFQRQLMMEREHTLRAASAHQHASLMAQQEEFLRLEQEARARSSQASVSRP